VEYAQARLQARFGERPAESLWRRLDAARELSAFLEMARGIGMRRWVAGLEERSSSHGIEIALRERLRSTIREVARWMPEEWRAAALWTLHPVDLPVLVHLARGHAPYAWMADDPVLAPYAAGDAAMRRSALVNDPELDFLAPAFAGEAAQGSAPTASAVRAAWAKRWRSLWPQTGGEARESVARLAQCVERNSRVLSRSSPDRSAAAGLVFGEQLRRLFRSSSLLPGAAFTYLAIAALDLERLRRGLLLRTLFPREVSQP